MSDDATRTTIGSGRILPEDTVVDGRYRILKLLGVGAMGMVYLARDRDLDIDVALKVLRTDGATRELNLERFRSELVLARQISHRNVVRIHDIGRSADLHFITMDYVDGRSLKQVLETEGPLPPERALAIAADLADALAEAHHADIVHRDIKPANVMLGSDRAYVTDFGIARSLHTDGMTRTGEIVGTLDYLSPEQARSEAVDGRSDIYALGLLLYEMLNGKLPFSGETAEEVLAQRTLARPRKLVGRNVPARLRAILERCLAVDPDERYRDAAALAADLRAGHALYRWRLPRKTLAATAVVAVVGLGLWAVMSGRLEPPQGVPAITEPLAVLPFDVAVGGDTPAGVAYGLAELLTEQLQAGAAVPVVASQRVTATMQDLKLTSAGLPAADQALLGDLLDAGYLVIGRVQRVEGAFHLEARLRRASSGELLHRATVDVRDAGEIFSATGSLGRQLLASLDVPPPPGELPLPVEDADVQNSFSSGAEYLSRGNPLAAIEPLEAAVRDAPGFALAWNRLAEALSAVGRDREALRAAEAAVRALGDRSGRGAALVRARRAALAGSPGEAARELEAMLDDHPTDTELRFSLAEFYGDMGRFGAARAALEQVVGGSPDHPQAWYLLGKYSILEGEVRRAADDYLVKALVIQNRLGNRHGQADVLNALGIAQSQLGNISRAMDYYRQALELREEIDDRRGTAAVLANMARIDLQQGRYVDARDGLVAARDRLADIGDRSTVANLENELGFLAELRASFDGALAHYREALRIRRDLGDLRALAESYNNVGYAYYLLGEYDNAAVFNEQSLSTYRETGNQEGVMLASQAMGILQTARGSYEEALKALLESLRISRELDDLAAEAVAEGYIGRVRHLQGRYAAAAELYDGALEKLADLGDQRGVAEFLLRQAELALSTGCFDAARKAADRASGLLDEDDNAARRALQLHVQGRLQSATGAGDAAERFRAALEKARASGEREAILRARLALAATPGDTTTNAAARLTALEDLYAEAQRLGHGALQYEAAIALADARRLAGRHDDAERLLRDALAADDAASGGAGDYRVYVSLADTLAAAGRTDEAAAAWQQAGQAIDRAMNAQNETQQRAFTELPEVRRALEELDEKHEI